jgi:hypothetical protein
MAGTTSKKGSPAWRRGVERARAQAVALLKRIGPNPDQLTDEQRKKILKKLTADLQRLVRHIDEHLAEIPSETPSPPPAAPGTARTRGRGRRA